jgi:hypothetical protein
MKNYSLVFSLVMFVRGSPLAADTIYQANAQGKQVVIQRDAILVKEDSAILVYKHFDLRERRIVKVSLNKGSLPYTATPASSSERREIVETWKRFGYRATIVDQTGKVSQIYDAYLDFYPPGGRGSLLEALPAKTSFSLLLEGGAADELEFSKIDRVEFTSDRLKVTLRGGQEEEGRFLSPATDQPAEVRFLGVTEQYSPQSDEVFDFSLPLARAKEIRFEP